MIITQTELHFNLVECFRCGIRFGLPSQYQANLVDDKAIWYCPNGHSQAYTGKTTRELLDQAKEDLKTQREGCWQAEDKVARQAKQLAALRRRVKEGKK
ncbi:hypothetical protein LCGC14_2455600 [marine sediment metagenome]|uniref:Uncharacterized protein n=1 Tax=marine sediment metagenome TaxID=412755 RepID=A0A0F9DRY7_9ZZZZ